MHPTRRDLLRSIATAAPTLGIARAAAAATGPDGLHVQPWFLQSFLDIREDIETAAASGKRLAISIEQKGCIYCRDMHEVNLADPAIVEFIKSRFELVQLDMHGARSITDIDGKEMEERDFVRRVRTVATPTIIFPPGRIAADERRPLTALEVARMPGYLPPAEFLAMFRFVADEAYARGTFREYLRTRQP